MKLTRDNFTFLFGLCLLISTCTTTAETVLDFQMRDSYLPAVPVLVRMNLRDESGRVRRDIWDAVAEISVDDANVTVSPESFALRNGVGSGLITFSGGSNMAVTVTVGTQEVSRALVTLVDAPMTNVAGTLPGTNTSWTGVVHVTGDVLVDTNHTLTIDPGTLVLLDAEPSGTNGVDIDVRGTINSLGTATQPVTFTAFDTSQEWGEIHHDDASPSLYRHTAITRGGNAPGGGHTGSGPALRVSGSSIVFEDCTISDLAGKIMQASSGSDLTFTNCHLARAVMGPEINDTAALVVNTWITKMNGVDDNDGMYCHSQEEGQTILFRGGVVADGDDDAIDTLRAEVTVEDYIIRDFFDKGVTVFGAEVTLNRVLITDNGIGVSAKQTDYGTARVNISSATIEGNDVGIQAEDKYGEPNVTILFFITNSIIEADNTGSDPVHTDYDPTNIVIHYSNVGEPWPGTGNISSDPMFINGGEQNYRFQALSPCVDAGTNVAGLAGLLDLDGNLRLLGERIDMGAYEQSALVCDFVASPREGEAPLESVLTATIGGTNTAAPVYCWDLDDDGVYELKGPGYAVVTNTYTDLGFYAVALVVSNAAGESAMMAKDDYIQVTVTVIATYVSPTGSNLYPYASWETAARSIQDAVDASKGLVFVTNGTYVLDSQVTISDTVTVRSVNGPGVTFVDGNQSTRCFYLEHAEAVLDGFTVRNGYSTTGSGISLSGGGSVINCTVVSNTAGPGTSSSMDAGGIRCDGGGMVSNCIVYGNSAGDDGGGIYCLGGGEVRGCVVRDNLTGDKGGGIYCKGGGTVENSTLYGNTAASATKGTGGGVYNDGGYVVNSIIYSNTANLGSDNYHIAGGGTYSHCCSDSAASADSITNAPMFVDAAANYFRLQPVSKCIDAGTNIAGVVVDIAGTPRPLDGDTNGVVALDIGAYEYLHPDADSDGDGSTDGDEAIAGTGMLDESDYLHVSSVKGSDSGAVEITWDGNEGRLYKVYTTTDLLPPAWSNVFNLSGADGILTYTNPAPEANLLYIRIGVEEE
ncbi:MAG: choice-of-anchor Q domain-containing protein [Kiritimatiellia bacterium]|nr:choice-of-anchor Q domain-containing protein [Kiritimatiellia bacterium]MDP6848168.1 choice-of-anchor Q domain-containing protein [Kiritimatiellia bacterium]